MLSVKCPNCGSTIRFEENRIATFCTYCGAHLPDMTGYVKRAADLEIQKKEHNMEMETLEQQARIENIRNKANTTFDVLNIIKAVIVGVIVLSFFLLLLKLVSM